MSSNVLFVIVLLIFISFNSAIDGLVCKGCLELDELTFDKVISKFSAVLVKFDVAYPYGKKHDEYAKFAKDVSESNVGDIAVSVVGIKNYGDPTNNNLAERFNIGDQLPVIKLFTGFSALKMVDFPKGTIRRYFVPFLIKKYEKITR